MTILVALALAAAAPHTSAAPVTAWANCMSKYALPRLSAQPTEKIVDGGFVACAIQEKAVRRAYIHDMGQKAGQSAFTGLRKQVREHMIETVDAAKAAQDNH
jgi:hypothetical protein